MKFARLVALVLLLVSCQATPTIDENNGETWELQPFYGELRFLIVEKDTDTPIPDATLRVSDLPIEELKNGESVKSDQEGQMVVHQLERGITYWGASPPFPLFTFSAPSYYTRTYSVEYLAFGTSYDPYNNANLPTTIFKNETGAEIELPVYEFTIHLKPIPTATALPTPTLLPTSTPTPTPLPPGWQFYPIEAGLHKDGYRGFYSVPDGGVWVINWKDIGEPLGSVAYFDGNEWKIYVSSRELPENVSMIFLFSKEKLCVAGAEPKEEDKRNFILSCFDQGAESIIYRGDYPGNMDVMDLYMTSDGEVWSLSWDGDVFNLQEGTWVKFKNGDPMNLCFKSLLVDYQDNVWITRQDVTRFDGTTWTTYTLESLLNGRECTHGGMGHNCGISLLDFGPELGLWASIINCGISHFEQDGWVNYTFDDEDDYIDDIHITSEGKLWVLYDKGYARFDDNSWVIYEFDDELQKKNFDEIAVTSTGKIWLTTRHCEGVVYLEGDSWTEYTVDDGLVSNCVEYIDVKQEDVVWFIFREGIELYSSSK